MYYVPTQLSGLRLTAVRARPCAHGLLGKTPPHLSGYGARHECDDYARLLNGVSVLQRRGARKSERTLIVSPHRPWPDVADLAPDYARRFGLRYAVLHHNEHSCLVAFTLPGSDVGAEVDARAL